MIQKTIPAVLVLLMAWMAGCRHENGKPSSSSQPVTLTEWEGIYLGTLPCQDCEGIAATLTLNRNMTYILRTESPVKRDSQVLQRGALTVDTARHILTLQGVADGVSQFLIGDGTLTPYLRAEKPVAGAMAEPYVLTRTAASDLVGNRWNLDVLMGKDIGINPAYIMFDVQRGRVGGYGWCNAFSGTLALQHQNQLTITDISSGENICKDTLLEAQFLNMLSSVSGFTVKGGQLSLYRVESRPLAKFNKADIRFPSR